MQDMRESHGLANFAKSGWHQQHIDAA